MSRAVEMQHGLPRSSHLTADSRHGIKVILPAEGGALVSDLAGGNQLSVKGCHSLSSGHNPNLTKLNPMRSSRWPVARTNDSLTSR